MRGDEQVDVQFEVAGADRHLHSVSLTTRVGERTGDGRLGSAVEAQHAPCPGLGAAEQALERRRLEHTRPELLKLSGRSGQRDRDARVALQHDRRGGADHPHPDGAVRQHRLLRHAFGEVAPRPVQPRRDPARQLLDRLAQRLLEVQPDARGTCEQLDRAVVVGRAEPAGDHQ